MPLTDDLYRDIILEHFKSPRNPGRLDKPTLTSHGANPFCGDEMDLTLRVEGGALADIRVDGKGCSISQSSASMMTDAVKGLTLEKAEELAQRFKATMLHNAPLEVPPEMEDLKALEGVKKYPVRIKCAILSWNTLLEGIAAYRKGKPEASHTEGEEGERAPEPELSAVPEAPANGARINPGTEPGAAAAPASPPEEEVRAVLTKVMDPELNLNIVDLGLVYKIGVESGKVHVVYSLTSPGCPLGPVIKGQIQSALGKIPWVKEIQTELVWQPPWDPRAMASEEVKTELGIW